MILAIGIGCIIPMRSHIDGFSVILMGRTLIEGRADPFPIIDVIICDEGGLLGINLLRGDRKEVSLEIGRLTRLQIHVFKSQILGLQGWIRLYKPTVGLQRRPSEFVCKAHMGAIRLCLPHLLLHDLKPQIREPLIVRQHAYMLAIPVAVYPCVIGTGVGIARIKPLPRQLARHLPGLYPSVVKS